MTGQIPKADFIGVGTGIVIVEQIFMPIILLILAITFFILLEPILSKRKASKIRIFSSVCILFVCSLALGAHYNQKQLYKELNKDGPKVAKLVPVEEGLWKQ